MKLYNIKEDNIDKFFEVIDSCEGKVEIIGEDFRLNLKSNFCKYVSIAKVFCNSDIKEIELVAHNPDDVMKLMRFMTYN